MTASISQSKSRGLFSPQRILFVLPIFLGMSVGGLLVMSAVLPLFVKLQQVQEEVELMELQQIGLQAQRDRMRRLETELKDKKEQQTRLVSLVAGPNQLNTLLATLNSLTAAAGVQVTAVETQALVEYVPPSPVQDLDAEGEMDLPPAPPTDPLLRPGLERRSVLIALQGSYPALLVFLRELESLAAITITNQLTLLNSGQPEEPTQLTLDLSAYGRS